MADIRQTSMFDYDLIDGVERLDKYLPGGYHPVNVGDTMHERYLIVDKLGYGGYSTIWLARDILLKRYVALKVAIADSVPREVKTLRELSEGSGVSHAPALVPARSSIPLPLDEFSIHGPNGKHACFTMPPAQCDLKEASFCRFYPIDIARALSAATALSLSYVHSKGYAHGDLHLRNILVKLPSSFDDLSLEQFREEYGKPEEISITRSDGKPLPLNVPPKAVEPVWLGKYADEFTPEDTEILLGDFGEAFNPEQESRLGEDCHTPPAARPPEAFFQPKLPLQLSADIWSLGVALWRLLGIKDIFSSEFATEDTVTSQQMDVLGRLPQDWWDRWESRQEFFDKNGKPRNGRSVWPPIEMTFEEDLQKYRRKSEQEVFSEEEKDAILDLMRRMLSFRPEERPSIHDVLVSRWMVNWAIPALERCKQTAGRT